MTIPIPSDLSAPAPAARRSFPRFLRTVLVVAPLLAWAQAQTVPAGNGTPATAARPATSSDGDVLTLSEFRVSTTQDKGYRAGNSVSATRIDTPIKDLPFAISAFTEQFITDIGARDLFDVVRYAPGVTTAGREFNAGNAVYTIRGFPQPPQHDGFYEGTSGNVYVDTVNVDRVEVVKGPASLLYGQIAPGGTVNYLTKRAKPKAASTVTLQAGSYDYLRGTIDVNQPLIGDTLLFRINAGAENNFEYVEPSKSRTTVVAPTATWNIAKNLSLTANYQWFKRRETPPAVFKPNIEVATPASIVSSLNAAAGFPGPAAALTNKVGIDAANGFNNGTDVGFLMPYPFLSRTFNYNSANDTRKTELQTLNIELNAKFNEHWVGRGNFNYNTSRDSQVQTGIGTVNVAPPGSMAFDSTTGTWSVAPSWLALTTAQQTAAFQTYAESILANPQNVALGGNQPATLPRRQRWQNTWGHNSTAQFDLAGNYKFTWGNLKPVLGAFWQKSYGNNRITQNGGNAAQPFLRVWDLNPASPTFFVDSTTSFDPKTLPQLNTSALAYTSDQAVYGLINGSFLNDRLNVLAGVRYNRAQSQGTNYISGVVSQGLKAHGTTPQAGIGYKITREVMVYASYSESFTLPSTSILRVNNVPVGQAAPTTGVGKEIGVKTDLFNGRFSSTLALYEIEQKDIVQTTNQIVGGSTLATDTQGAKVRSRGVEYEVTLSLLNNWQIYASVAENDIRNIQEPAGNAMFLGAHPQLTAKTLANFWTRYTFDRTAVKGLWVGAGVNYSGQSAADTRNPYLFLPGYRLWNAALGYDWKWEKYAFTATLNLNNIANREYFPANQQRDLPRRAVFSLAAKF